MICLAAQRDRFLGICRIHMHDLYDRMYCLLTDTAMHVHHWAHYTSANVNRVGRRT